MEGLGEGKREEGRRREKEGSGEGVLRGVYTFTLNNKGVLGFTRLARNGDQATLL